MSRTRRQRGADRSRRRKRNPGLRHYKRSILMICMVLMFLMGALGVSSLSLYAKDNEYKEQEEELQAQIEEEEQRSEEIDEFEEYVKTDDYIKELAEDKLGLVDPDEIIFKPSE